MEFHEKSLELNITHELLNLADSWYWFLTDIPLWRYWRPRHRLPFLKVPKSTAGGFHITIEGKNDSTGNAGGGFDVRIKSGAGKHLLFIQYKKGKIELNSPGTGSIFDNSPYEHFNFSINNTSTNQHFVLRDLANGIGKTKGNAVVYAFPLIQDMDELETHGGKLLRKTKFISIRDLDYQASIQKPPVTFNKGSSHNFRICKTDMNRCEVNYYYFFFRGADRSKDIISDIIAIRFQKTLFLFLEEIKKNYFEYNLSQEYIPYGIQQAYIQYMRFLLHYFEVSPEKLSYPLSFKYLEFFDMEEFNKYESNQRDIEILNAVFTALKDFEKFISSLDTRSVNTFLEGVPQYKPSFLISLNQKDILINFDKAIPQEIIENVSYITL